ncbi:hypothetical protein DAD66_05435 [Streptococcus agalactiae]|uniref:hypothetical protein n=1 Tax=Streptococcus agalactiae TaxID=1311 RepID=UPI001143AD48|nr:hypothetical protein [Streptococcus agalactiae]MCC9673794.1 hypothetical protein [Streptococcus agalactiae]MCC9714054.1 hypothetical protein [Streptococcus agalactiae]MCC9747309.1 hypothetical protein [Streptococcus agalactiae]TQB91680.1 hypothetical protein DAD74_00505 [Streptococcus agalactiae]TQC00622.1 hypothetical protein DAD71_00315 [Streptococcus agalactiae]
MGTITAQIEVCITELENYSPSLAELLKSQYYLLEQMNATLSDYEDFLSDLQGAIRIFDKESEVSK